MKNIFTIVSSAFIYAVVFTANADTLTVEPPVTDTSNTGIVIQDVYNNDTGEYVGQQTTYDYGNGNTVTEITINEGDE